MLCADGGVGCMGQISEAKLNVVKGLVGQSPDAAVRTLLLALSDRALDPGLAAVKSIVETEAADRRVRNTVLAPIAPLCAPNAAGGIRFPPRTLSLIWKALASVAPAEMDA